MRYSLQTKLSLSYVLVILFLIASVSFMTNFLLERQFKSYIISEQERKNIELVSLIGRQYDNGSNLWDASVLENIGVNALEQGMIIKVKDASGNTIWDATVHNSGLCMQMLDHMAHNMYSRYPNFKGGYVESSYPVLQDGTRVGNVDIGYYGPFYFSDNDLAFINTLNKMFAGTGLLFLLFALLLGAYMAKRLSRPISGVMKAARQIAGGDYSNRINEPSDTREIEQLTVTINDLAETLEKQESLRRRLTADMAHELRTPLATLQSHMEAMIDGIWTPDTDRLKSCHDEIMRIGRMIGSLEKLARVEGENITLNKIRFNLKELVSSIIRNFEADFLNKGVDISFTGDEVEINADYDKIGQIIVNLLSNALKYTPPGGKASVDIKNLQKAVEITVSDTGIGIHRDDLPYIFERFYRADKSRNTLTGGFGIGLAIVKGIAEAHRGRVEVESEQGRGASFRLILPTG